MLKRYGRVLSCVRIDEVLILQGAPLIGAMYAIGSLTVVKCLAFLVFTLGSCCLVAHVFSFNDWAGIKTDSNDPHRAVSVFTVKGVQRKEIGYLCLFLLFASCLLLWPFGATTLLIAGAIVIASTVYSAPVLNWKTVSLANSALHLFGGLLHFMLGYSIFSTLDGKSLAIGSFFGLMFAAGHLTHEARDHEGDVLNGIRTNAVSLGRTESFIAGLVMFTIADGLLAGLVLQGIVSKTLAIVALIYPAHLYLALQTLRKGLRFQTIRQLQTQYRALYAIIGLTMVITIMIGG